MAYPTPTAIDKKTLKTKRQLLTDRQRKQRLRERKQRIADATKAIYNLLREHFDNPYEAWEALAALVEHFEWEYHCHGFPDVWSDGIEYSAVARRARRSRGEGGLEIDKSSTEHGP